MVIFAANNFDYNPQLKITSQDMYRIALIMLALVMPLGALAQSRMPDFIVDPSLMVADSAATRSVPNYYWKWASTERFPHVGNPHIPVILIEYPDYLLTYNQRSDWDEWLNGSATQYDNVYQSYSSVAEYFDYCSGGKFRPVFDIYGPYTLDDPRTKYGYNKELDLMNAALKVADGDIDFSQYATVNPEICDLVYVIAAGEGSHITKNNSDINPMCGVNTLGGEYDGIKIRNWGVSNELLILYGEKMQTGIGVFCHELSHGMGLPDLYPYVTKNDYNNDEPEAWDLMDDGENSLYGFWPHPYNAWERDVMGWIEPDTLSQSRTVTLYPLADERGKACKFVNPYNDKEWWMIENIPAGETIDPQGVAVREGWYRWAQEYAGGRNGLLIMHMDNNENSRGIPYLSLAADPNPNDASSSLGGQPRCTVLPADSLLISGLNPDYFPTTLPDGTQVPTTWAMYDESFKGDLYPGRSEVTSLWKFRNYYGTPDASGKVKDLTDEGFAIRNITLNEDGSVTFDFCYGDAPTAIQEIKDHKSLMQDDIYYITPNLIVRNGKLLWLTAR